MDNRFDLIPNRPECCAWVARSAAIVLAVPLAAVMIVLPLLFMFLALLIYALRAVKYL